MIEWAVRFLTCQHLSVRLASHLADPSGTFEHSSGCDNYRLGALLSSTSVSSLFIVQSIFSEVQI